MQLDVEAIEVWAELSEDQYGALPKHQGCTVVLFSKAETLLPRY